MIISTSDLCPHLHYMVDLVGRLLYNELSHEQQGQLCPEPVTYIQTRRFTVMLDQFEISDTLIPKRKENIFNLVFIIISKNEERPKTNHKVTHYDCFCFVVCCVKTIKFGTENHLIDVMYMRYWIYWDESTKAVKLTCLLCKMCVYETFLHRLVDPNVILSFLRNIRPTL